MAWQPVSSEVGVKGFKQSCVSNAMDTTDIYIYIYIYIHIHIYIYIYAVEWQ